MYIVKANLGENRVFWGNFGNMGILEGFGGEMGNFWGENYDSLWNI